MVQSVQLSFFCSPITPIAGSLHTADVVKIDRLNIRSSRQNVAILSDNQISTKETLATMIMKCKISDLFNFRDIKKLQHKEHLPQERSFVDWIMVIILSKK